jgi:sigma-B regulation protein RsbU (phosphoserine phosphatase)
LVPLLLFPVTLSYVISVRRALDVKATLRRGFQYALIERGLNISQLLVTAGVIGVIALLGTGKDVSLENRIEIIVVGVVAIVALRPLAQRLAKWIDRIFFRAALNDEQVLRGLALSLRTLMDESTLMETLTEKISAALHVPRVALLLDAGGEFTPACATGYSTEPPFSLPESGGIARYLNAVQKASPIYFDDEKNWIQTIHSIDQESLKQERTEVLLPIAVKAKLLGIVVLGPKRAEAPYTVRDLQLLDVVAAQAGFSLENSRLAAQWALANAANEKQLR